MGRLKLVISDFHIADGQKPGEINPFEGFLEDDKFASLLHHYSSDYYEDEDVELIINGDFLDLLTVRHGGGFPTEITEEIAASKVRQCMEGHPRIVDAMRSFLAKPFKRITYIPGNHDWDLIYPAAQREMVRAITGEDESALITFITDRDHYDFDGVEIHHGQQWEAMNRFEIDRPFLTNGKGERILNLPWGSIFVLKVLNRFKEKRPYIDRIQPFGLYLAGAFLFDTWFAITLTFALLSEFVKMRFIEGRKRHANLLTTFEIIWEYSAFPNMESKARKILQKKPHVHTLLAGHTHLAKMRRFGPDKTYINTGTWTDLISLEISTLGRSNKHLYVLIEYPEQDEELPAPGAAGEEAAAAAALAAARRVPVRPRVSLKEWLGYHDLTRDITY